jgi:hypothetical protein
MAVEERLSDRYLFDGGLSIEEAFGADPKCEDSELIDQAASTGAKPKVEANSQRVDAERRRHTEALDRRSLTWSPRFDVVINGVRSTETGSS